MTENDRSFYHSLSWALFMTGVVVPTRIGVLVMAVASVGAILTRKKERRLGHGPPRQGDW